MRVIAALGHAGKPTDAVVIDYKRKAIWCSGSKIYQAVGHNNHAGFLVRAMYLSRVGRGPISMQEMITAIWSDRTDGGPLTAAMCIWVTVNRAQDTFRECGVTLIPNYTRGYSAEWAQRPVSIAA